MNTINSIILEGRLVRDPVLKVTPNGTEVCNFSLATNRYYMSNNEKVSETSFFDVETWADTARLCSTDGRKGRGVRVVGRLKQDRWKGSDGKNYSRIKVVADNVAFRPMSNTEKDRSNVLASDVMENEEVAEPAAVAF
ncbi:MAG: single-stranded DNA-binding protein [Treponemataceae bacterium]